MKPREVTNSGVVDTSFAYLRRTAALLGVEQLLRRAIREAGREDDAEEEAAKG